MSDKTKSILLLAVGVAALVAIITWGIKPLINL